jgi:hypothetical protein
MISFSIYDIVTCMFLPWYVTNLKIAFKKPKIVADNYLTFKTKSNLLIIRNQSYRAVNTFHHGYRVCLNLLKTKSNLLYIRNQSVPRCKHFPPQL